MTALGQTWDLARREFVQRAKSRAFQVMMLVTVGLVLAVIPLMALALEEPDPAVIGIAGDVPVGLDTALELQAEQLDTEIVVRRYPTIGAAEDAIERGLAAAVVTGDSIIWREEESVRVKAVIVGAASAAAFGDAAATLELSPEELAALLTPPALQDRMLVEPDPEEEPRRIGALVGLTLLYMSILIFGQFVAMGVMEEKQNRVVEVILSRVRPSRLLVAKVVGIGALGLAQLVLLGGAIWLAVNLVDITDVSLSSLGAEILVSVVFWFVLGYIVYSVMYAALGATVSRQEDLQSVVMLPVVVLLPGFFLAQVAQEIPDAGWVVATSMFPLWSPMLMPVRAAVIDVPLWQMAAAILLAVAAAYGMIRLGARVYTGAVLSIGAKVRLRDAWRSSA